MATKKYLDLSGLTQYDTKIKSVIPSKTSDLTNDSGFITDSKVVIVEYGSNVYYSDLKNYIDNGYEVICKYDYDGIGTYMYYPLTEVFESTTPHYCHFSGFATNGGSSLLLKLTKNMMTKDVENYGTWSYAYKYLDEDIRINNVSIVSNNIANIETNGTYNSSTNKIATMSDIPTFVTTDETLCSSLSLNANSQISATDKSITKSGYKPLGIMGYSMTGTNHQSTNIVILDLTASNNGSGTIQYRFRNLSASATATITLTAKVLWLKV